MQGYGLRWIAPVEKDVETETLEKRLWAASDELRANSGLTSAQYSQPVLGLILLLRFADAKFGAHRAELEKAATGRRGSRVGDPGSYHSEGVIYLPKRARLGRAGVRRSQDPEGSPRLTVGAQGVEERSDAAAVDEGHHQVDAVGGVDLGEDLVAHARLAGRIGQERRVEEWDEGLRDGLGVAVGEREDGLEDVGGGRRALGGEGSGGSCRDDIDEWRARDVPSATRLGLSSEAMARTRTWRWWRARRSAASASWRGRRCGDAGLRPGW